ncbi:hypothetical protein JW916_01540 [Candidatus Sumerlaeota bacterium]|nr:hypothetical protein [Candidatus Sumerlaeota bacterium]
MSHRRPLILLVAFFPVLVPSIVRAETSPTLSAADTRSTVSVVSDAITVLPAPQADLMEILKSDRITLNVENAEITSLLKMMALSRRINIMSGAEVSGTVSVNLFQVPFDEALDAILGIGGFTRYTRNGIVYVTTEETRGKLPGQVNDLAIRSFKIHHTAAEELVETVKEFLSPAGQAVLSKQERIIVVRDAPDYVKSVARLIAEQDRAPTPPDLEVANIRIDHAVPEEILSSVEKLLSPSGKAVLGAKDRTIIVRDAPEFVSQIAGLIEERDQPPRQVLISAQILRVNHTNDLDLGVEFGHSWWDENDVDPIEAELQAGPFDVTLDNLNDAKAGLLLSDVSTGEAGLLWSAIWKDKRASLAALASKGKVETLAEPDILALDGEKASMIVGDKLGYKTFSRADDGTTFENVQFLDVGTQIEVTPRIAADGLIRLEILPKVSSGNIQDGVPLENTAEVATTMLVRDGETVVIGGLIDTRKERVRSQVPFLGDIPVLGLLFGKNNWVNRKTELVILITPHIVEPQMNPVMQAKLDRATQGASIFPPEELQAN